MNTTSRFKRHFFSLDDTLLLCLRAEALHSHVLVSFAWVDPLETDTELPLLSASGVIR